MSDSNTHDPSATQPTEPLPPHSASPDLTPPPASPYGRPPGYDAQPPAYGAQPPAYGAQPPAYGTPSYGQPPYGAQPPAYGAQPPAYGAQPPAYGAQAPAYGQQPVYGQPPYGTPARRTNVLAVVSLISSVAGFVLAWTWVLAVGIVVGVITGHLALAQIKRTGEAGRGMALAGVIVGWVGIGFGVLAVLAFAMLFAVGSVSSYT